MNGRPSRGSSCVTCSDQAVPVEVVEMLDDRMARVATGAAVSVALVDARPGDTVLVHAGEALAVVAAGP